MKRLSAAESDIQELGITEPNEIDIEAIAWSLGARVRYRPLDGCEAHIIGHGNQAIITVNSRSNPARQRFSTAHELGHWRFHRGRLLICRPEDIGDRAGKHTETEKTADRYAADMLMPRYIFDPVSRSYSELTLKTVKEIADIFQVSITATAIRLVEGRHSPAFVVCHGKAGRKWFARCCDVPSRWFPKEQLDSESLALEVVFGDRSENASPRVIGADAWFDCQEATRYEVYEQSIRVGPDDVLTILMLNDEEMLEEF